MYLACNFSLEAIGGKRAEPQFYIVVISKENTKHSSKSPVEKQKTKVSCLFQFLFPIWQNWVCHISYLKLSYIPTYTCTNTEKYKCMYANTYVCIQWVCLSV